MDDEGVSMYKVTLALLFVSSAVFGQDLSRTFQLKNNSTTRGLQEIATTLRTVFDVKQLSVDPAVATITIAGNADQIALAEWLLPKLDAIPGSSPAPQKYFFAGNSNDVVEVAAVKNAQTVVFLQEMLTTLRTVADIQKIYQLSPNTLIWRADPSHIELGEFLIAQLDQPAGPRSSPTIQTFHIDDPKFDSVMVYGLAHTSTTRDMQTILTTLRTVLQVMKIYQQSSGWYLAIRGDATQIQMAEWLIPKLDAAVPSLSDNQMQVPGGKDDVLKVFYVPQDANLGNLMQKVRATARIPVVYQNINPPALVVRSTADQIAMAGKLIAAN
jgi:hypothetical protein